MSTPSTIAGTDSTKAPGRMHFVPPIPINLLEKNGRSGGVSWRLHGQRKRRWAEHRFCLNRASGRQVLTEILSKGINVMKEAKRKPLEADMREWVATAGSNRGVVRVGFVEEVACEPKLGGCLETEPIKASRALVRIKGIISKTPGPQWDLSKQQLITIIIDNYHDNDTQATLK